MTQNVVLSDLLLNYDDFQIYEAFAKGSFSKSSRAKRPNSSDPEFIYSIKTFHEMKSVNELKSFLKSVEIQASLNHPAVQPLLGYFLPVGDEKVYGTAQQFMPSNLSELIENSKKDPKPDFETKRAIISIGIAAGMAYIHQKHIIHGDLKPLNILLDENNYPKITDFNVSNFYFPEKNSQMTLSIGTPLFMSPEVLSDPHYSEKIDVYSFSMVLYELWLLKRVWYEKGQISPIRLFRMVEKGERPRIKDGDFPKIIQDLICKCWSQTPSERPSFAQVVKDFIEHKNEYFDNGNVDMEELNQYIEKVVPGLDLN